MVILLEDMDDHIVDAVIVTKETTESEIKEIIADVRIKIEEQDWNVSLLEAIEEALPKDCEVYDRYKKGLSTIYY